MSQNSLMNVVVLFLCSKTSELDVFYFKKIMNVSYVRGMMS